MTGALSACPHCGETLKKSAFGTGNALLTDAEVELINVAYGETRTHACTRCGRYKADSAALPLDNKFFDLQNRIVAASAAVPLLSISAPDRWTYDCIGLVTAQSTTGTGIFSDITSAFTDLFGAQSKTYNNKIRAGEDIARTSLRLQAIAMGGNAVLGVDVDYAEVGGTRAMLMVCMTGTVVTLRNSGDFFPELAGTIAAINRLNEEIAYIQQLRARAPRLL